MKPNRRPPIFHPRIAGSRCSPAPGFGCLRGRVRIVLEPSAVGRCPARPFFSRFLPDPALRRTVGPCLRRISRSAWPRSMPRSPTARSASSAAEACGKHARPRPRRDADAGDDRCDGRHARLSGGLQGGAAAAPAIACLEPGVSALSRSRGRNHYLTAMAANSLDQLPGARPHAFSPASLQGHFPCAFRLPSA